MSIGKKSLGREDGHGFFVREVALRAMPTNRRTMLQFADPPPAHADGGQRPCGTILLRSGMPNLESMTC